MKSVQLLALGIASVSLSACSNNDIIIKRQTEFAARLEQVVEGGVTDRSRISQLTNDLKELQRIVASQATALEDLKQQQQDILTTLGSFQRLSSPQTAAPSPKIEVVNKEAVVADKDAGQQEAYMKAFGLFSANNYEEAIISFQAFLTQFPGSEYAGNAQYWIGECLYTQHRFQEALDAFNRVLTHYPTGKKVSDAMLKIGYSLISLNEQDKGKAALQLLLEKYPKSQAAAKARERLGTR
jgi:tol-pal system protein YbgF